ncbi:MAG: hypothetical protein EHM64_11680 [Ignavibacteriae bacterium]|nr:MAG: hypothetical protein EHM64_11680 [Ignavibacteriota bacterium]
MNMKIFIARTILLTALVLAVLYGCKYNVAEPLWDSPPASSEEVTITGVVPAQATAGVNVITIYGTNLTGALDTTIRRQYAYFMDTIMVNSVPTVRKDSTLISQSTFIYNGVYFDNVQATVIEKTPTMIRVLRPNLSGDTIRIKIASDSALVTAKYGPYKIDPVMQRFGTFTENYQLCTAALDNAGNLYIVKGTAPYTVFKITPSGSKTQVGATARQPLDAKIGPDGNMYYMGNGSSGAKPIGMINMQTGADSLWLNSTKFLTCFDFGSNGFMYAGGVRNGGLLVLRPNKSVRLQTAYYAADSIQAVRVFNGYVYVIAGASAPDANTPARAIWRHSLADTSTIGAKELVYDLTQAPNGFSPVRGMSISSDGSKLYVGFNGADPLLVVDVANKTSEVMYKGILPGYCKHFCLGSQLYAIMGNVATTAPVTPAVEWTVYKVDVGTSGAPYY